MGELILCRQIQAKKPYYLKSIEKNITTIEELCFFFYYHMHLLDNTVVEEALIQWLSDELLLSQLAGELETIMGEAYSVEDLVLHILRSTHYLSEEELDRYEHRLKKSLQSTVYERMKQRADSLVKCKSYQKAIQEYQQLLKDPDISNEQLVCDIYHNQGVAYAKMFAFLQSSYCFLEAFRLCPNTESLKQYKLSIRLSERDLREQEVAKNFPLAEHLEEQLKADIDNIDRSGSTKAKDVERLKGLKEENKVAEYYEHLENVLYQWKMECRKFMSE